MKVKQAVLDNVIQTIAGVVVGVSVPLAASHPDWAPYIAVADGAIAFVMGKMYPKWNEAAFSGEQV